MKTPKTPEQIWAKIEELEKKAIRLKFCQNQFDQADMREFKAQINALKWALGEREAL